MTKTINTHFYGTPLTFAQHMAVFLIAGCAGTEDKLALKQGALTALRKIDREG